MDCHASPEENDGREPGHESNRSGDRSHHGGERRSRRASAGRVTENNAGTEGVSGVRGYLYKQKAFLRKRQADATTTSSSVFHLSVR